MDLQKHKNAESGCFSLSLRPISTEKHPSPENVNLHGRIARSLAERLVGGKEVITVKQLPEYHRTYMEYERNSKPN